MTKPKRKPSDTRISEALHNEISKFDRAKKFKRKHPKPDLVNYPNIYKRRILDNEVIEILPYREALSHKVLRKKMLALMKKINMKLFWYDDLEVVAAINKTGEETKRPKIIVRPPRYKHESIKTAKEVQDEIKQLLTDLKDSTTLSEKKKIRRMLRKRGHVGGSRNGPAIID